MSNPVTFKRFPTVGVIREPVVQSETRPALVVSVPPPILASFADIRACDLGCLNAFIPGRISSR